MDADQAAVRARQLTDEALRDADLDDPRPAYRRLMIHLKGTDEAAFEEATRRFNETLVPDVASESVPPLEAWFGYATWLCEKIRPGSAVAIDGSGRATNETATLAAGTVVLHLPDEVSAPALLLAMPASPTPSQQVTVELLAR